MRQGPRHLYIPTPFSMARLYFVHREQSSSCHTPGSKKIRKDIRLIVFIRSSHMRRELRKQPAAAQEDNVLKTKRRDPTATTLSFPVPRLHQVEASHLCCSSYQTPILLFPPWRYVINVQNHGVEVCEDRTERKPLCYEVVYVARVV